MARSVLTDLLSDYPFWLFDAAPIEPVALPIFTPLLGFSTITSPEISLDTAEVREANWLFGTTVVKSGRAGAMTLTRGSRWFDADFYRWIMAALTGDTGGGVTGTTSLAAVGGVTPRRDLVLVHFLSRSPVKSEAANRATEAGLLGLAASLTANSVSSGIASGVAVAAAASMGGIGPFEFAARIPAKAWSLYGCIPTRYKAASDFDATSGAISMQELDIAVDYLEEISLSAV